MSDVVKQIQKRRDTSKHDVPVTSSAAAAAAVATVKAISAVTP